MGIEKGITQTVADKVLKIYLDSDGSEGINDIINRLDLWIEDRPEVLGKWVDDAIAKHPKAAKQYRDYLGGMRALVIAAVKASGGRLPPIIAAQKIAEKLGVELI